jgi:2,5-diketo-D-gluconate reductase B
MMQMLTARGMTMPKLGLGTFRMTGATCTDAVLHALEIGYRHVDTAQMYGNEAEVGAALATTAVKRSDIHLTTKVWWEQLAPDAMRRALETSLAKLRTDYVDLYLIHWPAPDMDLPAALASLVKLRDEGMTRHIGVSNFTTALLRRTVEEIGAPIVCNQIEYHVLLDQTRVVEYCRAHDIAVTAYCPLARGGLGIWPGMAEIAARHGATPEQIALQWLLEKPGVAAIPKASQPKNQQANWDAQQITLTDADRAAIAELPKDHRIVNPGMAPAWDPPMAG